MSPTVGWFEGAVAYPSIPDWVQWFIEAGRVLPSTDNGTRRLLLLSTPCDSPAAALVCLGVVIRDLTREDATDVINHARAIRTWARENPAGRLVRHVEGKRRTVFEVGLMDDGGELTLTEVKKTTTAKNASASARSRLRSERAGPEIVRFGEGENPDNILLEFTPDEEGWSAPQSATTKPPLSRESFSRITRNWNPIQQRLQESYSGACFAGRMAGKSRTIEFLKGFGFVVESGSGKNRQFGLDSMLTIDGWGDDSVSRLRYCNMRGNGPGKFNDRGTALELTVADGADELVKVFQNLHSRDFVAVVPRDAAVGKLEALSQSLEDRGFAKAIKGNHSLFGTPPPGVTAEWRIKS